MRELWSNLTVRVKVMTAAALALLLVLAGFGVWRLLVPADSPAKQAEAGAVDSSAGKKPSKEEPGVDLPLQKKTGVEGYTFKVDKNGYAVMPKTHDPKVAAAGAAAVLLTVNARKQHDIWKWRKEVESRVVRPGPGYKGGVGEVDNTRINGLQYDAASVDPMKLFHQGDVQEYSKYEQPKDYSSWIVNYKDYWQKLQYAGAVVHGIPAKVLSYEEVRKLDPEVDVSALPDYDLTPDTPGATEGEYWVLVKMNQVAGGDIFRVEEYVPMGFDIWCDAPKDGGLCGVHNMFFGIWPEQWNMKDYGPPRVGPPVLE